MIHKFEEIEKDSSHPRQHLRLHRRGAPLGREGPRHLPDGGRAERHDHRLHRHARRQTRKGGRARSRSSAPQDEEGYLDKYSIAESIEDETTLPIKHMMAPSEMTVPAERLDKEFFALAETEGVTDVEELNRVLDRAVGLRTFLGADDRIEKVAAFVAEHFQENVTAARLQGVPRRRRPRGLRQVQAGARQAPAAGVVGGRLHGERRRRRRPARWSPSCSSPRSARRRSAGSSRSRPRARRS